MSIMDEPDLSPSFATTRRSAKRDAPILFSAPMVRMILREIERPGDGKTQTRRVLKTQPKLFETDPGVMCDLDVCWDVDDGRGRIWLGKNGTGVLTTNTVPYAPGDRLWVRETWASAWDRYDEPPDVDWLYRATDNTPAVGRWKPAIHMPRIASRLTLTVTNVRVQRLWDINEADAIAEGAICAVMDSDGLFRETIDGGSFRTGFIGLWQHINGKRDGCGWDDNPWVVAVSFRPELRNIDARLPYDQAPTDPHHGGKIWA